MWLGSGSAWIRNFCLDPELGKFKAGSGSGINHSGSSTLVYRTGVSKFILVNVEMSENDDTKFFFFNPPEPACRAAATRD